MRYGGPIFAVHGLCRALTRRGHEVHVFTTNVDGDGVSDVPLNCPVEMDGVRVLHVTSQRELDDARQLDLPLPSPAIVPNGIDLPPLAAEPRDDRMLLFLGRVNWKKGLDRLIAAMRDVDARLVIAGNDEENYAAT